MKNLFFIFRLQWGMLFSFFFCAIVFCSPKVLGQHTFGGNFGVGITSYNSERGAGITYGLSVEFEISKHIVLHTGLNMSHMFVGGLIHIDYQRDVWRLSQMFVPLTIKLSPSSKDVRPYVNIGSSIGVLIHGEHEEYLDGVDPNVPFEKYKLDLIVGGGIMKKMKSGKIFFGVTNRYNLNDLTGKGDIYNLKVRFFEFFHMGILTNIDSNKSKE